MTTDTHKCNQCGSRDVWRLRWAPLNPRASSRVWGTEPPEPEQDNWCGYCDDYCDAVPVRDYDLDHRRNLDALGRQP